MDFSASSPKRILSLQRQSSSVISNSSFDHQQIHQHHHPTGEKLSKLNLNLLNFQQWWQRFSFHVNVFPEDIRSDIPYHLMETGVLEKISQVTGGRALSLSETKIILNRFVYPKSKQDDQLRAFKARKQQLRERVFDYILELRKLQPEALPEEHFWVFALNNLLPGYKNLNLQKNSDSLEFLVTKEDSIIERQGMWDPFPNCQSLVEVRTYLTPLDYELLGEEADLDYELSMRLDNCINQRTSKN